MSLIDIVVLVLFVGSVSMIAASIHLTIQMGKKSRDDARARKMEEDRLRYQHLRHESIRSETREDNVDEDFIISQPKPAGLLESLMPSALTQAGLTLSPVKLIGGCALAAVGLSIAVGLMGGGLIFSGIVGIISGLILPFLVIRHLKKLRVKKFLAEFPNAVDVIVRSLRTGIPLLEAFTIVAHESQEPVAGEFKVILEKTSIGLPLTDAVEIMDTRVNLNETTFFAIVIAISQKSGGNLGEALSNLSRLIRERKRMKMKIRAMSMEAKASSFIIAALPFAVAIVVTYSAPEYMNVLFHHMAGWMVLGACGIWMGIGIFVIAKLSDIKV